LLPLEEDVIIMNKKRRIHDGIVGAVITAGVLLGYYGNPLWLLVPGLLGITLLQIAFTGFCPLYYSLDRLGIAE
jgi:hypothetical protein